LPGQGRGCSSARPSPRRAQDAKGVIPHARVHLGCDFSAVDPDSGTKNGFIRSFEAHVSSVLPAVLVVVVSAT